MQFNGLSKKGENVIVRSDSDESHHFEHRIMRLLRFARLSATGRQ